MFSLKNQPISISDEKIIYLYEKRIFGFVSFMSRHEMLEKFPKTVNHQYSGQHL
jgi:hypothetical protein